MHVDLFQGKTESRIWLFLYWLLGRPLVKNCFLVCFTPVGPRSSSPLACRARKSEFVLWEAASKVWVARCSFPGDISDLNGLQGKYRMVCAGFQVLRRIRRFSLSLDTSLVAFKICKISFFQEKPGGKVFLSTPWTEPWGARHSESEES